jgi:hypothetical protein
MAAMLAGWGHWSIGRYLASFAFQPRHGMPSFQTALGHGIQPSLSVDVECNMTANMFSIMRATFTLQRALVNERSLAAEQNLPPLITCRQVSSRWPPSRAPEQPISTARSALSHRGRRPIYYPGDRPHQRFPTEQRDRDDRDLDGHL